PRIRRGVGIGFRQVRIALGRRRRAAGLLRIVEALRLEQRGDPLHVLRRFTRILQPRLQPDARIGSRRALLGATKCDERDDNRGETQHPDGGFHKWWLLKYRGGSPEGLRYESGQP